MQASPFIMTPNNNITEEILMRKEYFAQYYSEVYNITIDKTNSNIIIRNNCYEIKLDKQTLSLLTKVIFNTIDDMFTFSLNIFNQNKYYIKQILNNKMILVIGVYNMIEGREKEIELELKENFEDKNYLIKELFNRYSKMEKNIKEVNYNNQILKQENNKLIQENMNLKIDLENVKNNYGGIQMQINNIMNMINQIQQQLNQFNEQYNKINQQINQINFNNNNNKINEEEKNDELIDLKFYCFDENSQQYSIIIKCKPDDILQEQIMKFRQKDERYKNDDIFLANADFLDEKKFYKIKHLHLPSFNNTILIHVAKAKYHFKIKFIISNENFFVNEYEYNHIEKVSEIIKTEKTTFGQAAYLVGVYSGSVEESSDYDKAVSALKEKGVISADVDSNKEINLAELSYLCMQTTEMNGGLFYTLFPGPRYAFRELKARGILPALADPGVKVNGRDAIAVLNGCIEEDGE